MIVLVTGVAGFIGMHVAKILLERGDMVLGVDNLNDYYDPALKVSRLDNLKDYLGFKFIKGDISDSKFVSDIFTSNNIDCVIHLAAQAGVRYSIQNPAVYIQSNLVGFSNILEGCRKIKVKHLIYASSSSVYGANTRTPFSVSHNVDHPLSLYAATKKSNELMAHTYSHLYGIPTTGLRYFTVYGPWGRPDMAPWLFTSAICNSKSIDVYNFGKMKRDFTYIDDISEGTVRLIDFIPTHNPCYDFDFPNSAASSAPYRVFNIGNSTPVELNFFIESIEKSLGKKAVKNLLPMQDGDVVETYAEVSDLYLTTGFKPSVDISNGIERWVAWYRNYTGL